MVIHVFGHVFESDNFLRWVSGNAMSLVSFILIQIIGYRCEFYFRFWNFSCFSVSFLHECLSPLTIICQIDCTCFIALFIYMYVGHTKIVLDSQAKSLSGLVMSHRILMIPIMCNKINVLLVKYVLIFQKCSILYRLYKA